MTTAEFDLRDIPDFLRRTPGDSKPPPRQPSSRETARRLRDAKERALAQARTARRKRDRQKAEAMRGYRQMFGDRAPDPMSPGASPDQRLVYEGLLERAKR